MARHKETGPKSFLEWVVGTTVESAMKVPKKPRRRDVVRVEVSADDESGEDTLKITYPRTAPPPQETKPEPQAVVKKVRFDEAPRKSALKKTTTTIVMSESEPETEPETSDSAADTSSDGAVVGDVSTDSSDSSAKPSKPSKKSKKSVHVSDSDEDSEPHPTCKCVDCVRARQKLKKQSRAAVKQKKQVETDSSESEAEIPPKSKAPKTGKKASRAKSPPPESSEETSTSAPESEEEEEPVKKKAPQKSKAGGKKEQKKEKGEKAQPAGKMQKKKVDDEETEEDSAEEEEEEKPVKAKKNKKAGNKKAEPEVSKPPKQQNEAKKNNYPEAMPMPNPRRPHYIEPVRAEVVQTERVMETPQDPQPNAYYDAEHNIIRVYHGPVYGGNPNQALYPRRDPSMRPLPIGMPHPTQNPYHYGFNNQPLQEHPGFDHVPVTQGMPMNTWNPMCPPGMPPYQQGPPPGFHGPDPAMGKGAFANMKLGVNGGAPSSKDKDKAGANNVGPASVKSAKDNPYYKPRSQKSQFSNWGSNRAPSQVSHRTATGGDGQADQNAPSGSALGESGNAAELVGWGSQPNENNGNSGNNSNNGGGSWANFNNNGNTNDMPNTTEWGNGNNENVEPAPTVIEDNNVCPTATMPGSWEPATAGVPPWGDPTAAASTGGAVDQEAPSGGW